jgi:hypothetical protein
MNNVSPPLQQQGMQDDLFLAFCFLLSISVSLADSFTTRTALFLYGYDATRRSADTEMCLDPSSLFPQSNIYS